MKSSTLCGAILSHPTCHASMHDKLRHSCMAVPPALPQPLQRRLVCGCWRAGECSPTRSPCCGQSCRCCAQGSWGWLSLWSLMQSSSGVMTRCSIMTLSKKVRLTVKDYPIIHECRMRHILRPTCQCCTCRECGIDERPFVYSRSLVQQGMKGRMRWQKNKCHTAMCMHIAIAHVC